MNSELISKSSTNQKQNNGLPNFLNTQFEIKRLLVYKSYDLSFLIKDVIICVEFITNGLPEFDSALHNVKSKNHEIKKSKAWFQIPVKKNESFGIGCELKMEWFHFHVNHKCQTYSH